MLTSTLSFRSTSCVSPQASAPCRATGAGRAVSPFSDHVGTADGKCAAAGWGRRACAKRRDSGGLPAPEAECRRLRPRRASERRRAETRRGSGWLLPVGRSAPAAEGHERRTPKRRGYRLRLLAERSGGASPEHVEAARRAAAARRARSERRRSGRTCASTERRWRRSRDRLYPERGSGAEPPHGERVRGRLAVRGGSRLHRPKRRRRGARRRLAKQAATSGRGPEYPPANGLAEWRRARYRHRLPKQTPGSSSSRLPKQTPASSGRHRAAEQTRRGSSGWLSK
mmetsp:Transcript_44843/g.111136  ORF Transcript_44843/g.111136 Transcript_44843/m.111136 type:complete len:284 (+) Transcript_44843:48-899(+)